MKTTAYLQKSTAYLFLFFKLKLIDTFVALKKLISVKNKFLFFSLAASILFSACSTEIDVNGDWKETMIVYGLLDQSQAKQYIKINKAFLGNGNAYEDAQIKDSVQFVNALSVKLIKVSDGTVYNLSPDNSIPKDAGTFYGPDQTNAIYSAAIPLVTSSAYKLVVKNNESGQEVTSQTELINHFDFTAPNPSTLQFSIINSFSQAFRFKVEWNTSKNARLYQLKIRFNYIDSTTSGNIAQYIDWVFPIQTTERLDGSEKLSVDFRGQDYLQFIGNKLCNGCSTPSNLIARRATNTELLVSAGSDDLNTYMQVNAPSTGIIQDKPEFTNINNGLGLFTSRYNRAAFSKPLATTTLDSLACGQYTKNLKFLNSAGILPACP